jgi:hypothetical protein
LLLDDVSFMTLDEILNARWHISQLEIATPAQFASHVMGNVLGPSLYSVVGNYPGRIAILMVRRP